MADNQTLVEIRRLLDAQMNLHVSVTEADRGLSFTMDGFLLGAVPAVLTESETIADNWVRLVSIEFQCTVLGDVPTGVDWYLSRDEAGTEAITPYTSTAWYKLPAGDLATAAVNLDLLYRRVSTQTAGQIWIQMRTNAPASTANCTAFLFWSSNMHPPALYDNGC